MATIGQQLKRARDERSLTPEDVAFHTRIPVARVRDMENDDLSRFANLTYARGFLKIYGEFLGLDLGDYLSQFHTEEFAHASGHEYVQTANATQNLPAAVFTDHGRSRSPGIYVLGVLLAAAGGVIWWNNRGGGEKDAGLPSLTRSSEPASASRAGGPAAPELAQTAPADALGKEADQARPSAEVGSSPSSTAELSPAVVKVSPGTASEPEPASGPPPKAKVIEEQDP